MAQQTENILLIDVLACDTFIDVRTNKKLSGVRSLHLAVLESGLMDLLSPTKTFGERFGEALEWLMWDGEPYVFSFESLCEEFKIDAATLKRRILSLLNSGIRFKSPYRRSKNKMEATA